MAKRNPVEVPAKRNRNQKKPEIEKKENKSKGQNSKNKSNSRSNSKKGRKTATDDASSEDNDALVAPSSSSGSGNDDVAESCEAEDDQVGEIVEKKKSKINVETKKPKIKEENMPPPPKRKNENEDTKNKGKKRSKKEENDADAESDAEEKSENAFPMNRISRIIRGDNPGIRISQEAVFLINRASEKFLQLFCREAYACTFLEDKRYTAYNHLSSVVAKQTRFGFLSDFVPEKVKAGDSLAQIPEAEK